MNCRANPKMHERLAPSAKKCPEAFPLQTVHHAAPQIEARMNGNTGDTSKISKTRSDRKSGPKCVTVAPATSKLRKEIVRKIHAINFLKSEGQPAQANLFPHLLDGMERTRLPGISPLIFGL